MKIWQKCPICDASGLVSDGFFGTTGYLDEYGNRCWTGSNAAEMCRVCKGQGIIPTPDEVVDQIVLRKK